MKTKMLKSVLLVLSLVCILCFPVQVSAEPQQGTDGDELQLMEAEKLEIQLGTEWAGVEFQLKTDAGMYPGNVVVGEDGVLRMEIGGSKTYILSCLNSTVEIPEPTQAPATTEPEAESAEDKTVTDETQTETEAKTEIGEDTIAGIPILHIALFGGGLILAVTSLIVMHVVKRRREDEPAYDDDDEDE